MPPRFCLQAEPMQGMLVEPADRREPHVTRPTMISANDPAPAGPLFGDVGVIALVPDRWGGMWLSRHQILTRLSRYFHVVWQNPARPWRRALSPVSIASQEPTPPPAHGFTVYDPERWLPRLYRPRALARAAERMRLARARRMLEDAGCTRIVLYVWQPKFAGALDLVRHDVCCYHIVDEYSFSNVEEPLSPVERRLIERADQVIVHSPALRDKKGSLNPNTAYVTNGVDYAAFAAPHALPADLARIPAPRVGYVGRIKPQLDWKTLTAIAEARPDWSLVLVGPTGPMGEEEGERERLLAMANVHYMGNKPVAEVPAYIQHMDVCLMCYALTDYTKFIFPLKLHEYLASGRPVVGSDIRSLREFTSVIRIAHTPQEWCGAIAAALGPEENSPARVEARRRVAKQYDWNVLTRRVAGLFCERLGGDCAREFAALPAEPDHATSII
jgi:glycosyltransferase involved in cell wall biosynthesis